MYGERNKTTWRGLYSETVEQTIRDVWQTCNHSTYSSQQWRPTHLHKEFMVVVLQSIGRKARHEIWTAKEIHADTATKQRQQRHTTKGTR